MKILPALASALLIATLGASTASPVHAKAQGLGTSFKAPTGNTTIKKDGTCATPVFHWTVLSAYSDSMFNGSVRVTSGGKAYASTKGERFSVNRDQPLPVHKPVCKPGKYTIVLKGKVTSTTPSGDGSYKSYGKVSGQRTFKIKKAS